MPAMDDNDRRAENGPQDLLQSARFVAVDRLIERHRAEFLTLLADELDARAAHLTA